MTSITTCHRKGHQRLNSCISIALIEVTNCKPWNALMHLSILLGFAAPLPSHAVWATRACLRYTAIGDAKHESKVTTGSQMFHHPSEQSQPIRFNTTQSYKARGPYPDMSARITVIEMKTNLWEMCLIDLLLNKWKLSLEELAVSDVFFGKRQFFSGLECHI